MAESKEGLVISNVLIQKFLETQDNFYRVIHEVLYFSKDWIDQSIEFKLPTEIKRINIKKWNHDRNHDWDTSICCNWELDNRIIQCLLKIQPIDFWVLFLKMRSYENSLDNLNSFKSFATFLNSYSSNRFPVDQWHNFYTYSKEIFDKVRKEDVITILKVQKIQLYFVEKVGVGKMQVNMMNIILYSILFNLNHIEITILCIFISHLLIFIEVGLDTDKESANPSTIANWNENGNWGKVVNYYLFLATSVYEPSMKNFDLKKCLAFIIKEDGFRLYPFEFKLEKLDELINFKNEKMRSIINSIRKKENSNEQIFIDASI
jgi:hypothetical protein